MEFAEILKDLRAEKGLKQKELAKLSGLSAQCISTLELGTRAPTGITLLMLANALNVSTDYLLGRTDELGSVVMPSSAPTLSGEERRLLAAFRELDPRLRSLLWDMIQTWQQGGSSASDTKKHA